MSKRGEAATVLLLSILVIFLIFLAVLLYYLYFPNNSDNSNNPNDPNNPENPSNPDNPNNPSDPHDPINPRNSSDPSNPTLNCNFSIDPYILPDFDRLSNILINEQMVKDLPSSGSIRLRFFHFLGDCRKWDKSYLITKNKVEEKDSTTDIDIWLHTNYVDNVQPNNLCEVITQAKAHNDFGQSSSLSRTSLLIKYSSMLKYRSCFGF